MIALSHRVPKRPNAQESKQLSWFLEEEKKTGGAGSFVGSSRDKPSELSQYWGENRERTTKAIIPVVFMSYGEEWAFHGCVVILFR